MKTSKTNKSYPNGKKIIFYVTVVAAFCFLNCLALQARDYTSRYCYTDQAGITVTNERQTEALLQVQNWNFDFQTMIIAYIIQHRFKQSPVRARQSQAPVREYNARPSLNAETRRAGTRSLLGQASLNEF